MTLVVELAGDHHRIVGIVAHARDVRAGPAHHRDGVEQPRLVELVAKHEETHPSDGLRATEVNALRGGEEDAGPKHGVHYRFCRHVPVGNFDGGIGAKIENGTTSFKELDEYAHKNGEVKRISGQQELYEVLINKYV